jgi:hypothetical protein
MALKKKTLATVLLLLSVKSKTVELWFPLEVERRGGVEKRRMEGNVEESTTSCHGVDPVAIGVQQVEAHCAVLLFGLNNQSSPQYTHTQFKGLVFFQVNRTHTHTAHQSKLRF